METTVFREQLAGKAFSWDSHETFCFARWSYLMHTFFTHTIYTHITHILSNLGFHKNTYHITTKIGPQNYTISTKKPKIINFVGKT